MWEGHVGAPGLKKSALWITFSSSAFMYYVFMVNSSPAGLLGAHSQPVTAGGAGAPKIRFLFQQKKLPGGWLSLNLSLWMEHKRSGAKFAMVMVSTTK